MGRTRCLYLFLFCLICGVTFPYGKKQKVQGRSRHDKIPIFAADRWRSAIKKPTIIAISTYQKHKTMSKQKLFNLLGTALLVAASATTQAQVVLDFDMADRGPAITPNHYGVFFEEINHGGDGGLYAEMINNRSFEANSSKADSWSTVGNATTTITAGGMLNENQGHALIVKMNVVKAGIRNEGYYGMTIREGTTYKLSFWVRPLDGYRGNIVAQLQDKDGKSLGDTTIVISKANQWAHYTAEITATGSAVTSGYLALLGTARGTVKYDVVSLFPPTWKNRENGCRIDLAEKIAAMKPAFVRFPGGCYIEGWEGWGSHNRYEWKKTIGPIENRPGHQNSGWGYWVNDGLGYQELLQFTEDLGAEGLFVVNMGFGHGWDDGYDAAVTTYLQEALDAIEFAIGDTTTTYGRLRAQYGHPAPYPLKYIEIGNENENFAQYAERHYVFYKAIKKKYPQLTLITDGAGFNSSTPTEMGDWHDYTDPAWMISNYARFDNRSRAAAKVYEGEYAVTADGGFRGNLNAAIGEAVYMEGMENNSDVCVMASYAPLLCNEGRVSWHPDCIWFNSDFSYGTPSYHVQKMFANNIGKVNVKWTENGNVAALRDNSFGLGTWRTDATFSDVRLMSDDSVVINADTTQASNWKVSSGQWKQANGVFTQTDASVSGAKYLYLPTHTLTNYTLKLKARKNSGEEGFLIIFDYRDANNMTWWNIGGWGNTQHAVEQTVNGTRSILGQTVKGSLDDGVDYDIRIEKNGNKAKCYMNGKLIHEVTLNAYAASRNVYTAASIDDETGELFIKLVNPNSSAQPTVLKFDNGRPVSASAEVLTSAKGTDENTPENPNLVSTDSTTLMVDGDSIVFNVRPLSVNVVKVKMTQVRTKEPATLPHAKATYSFEAGQPVDDSGTYKGALMGDATIAELSDGNHALYSGGIGGKGYMSLGKAVVKDVLGGGNDFTVSMNILTMPENNFSQYSWALSFGNGTARYLGFINASGANNWFAEWVNDERTSLNSNGGLRVGEWHNLTFTRQANTCSFYLDGFKVAEKNVTTPTATLVRSLTGAYIAKSPFSADAIMENCYFDDLRFYDESLDADQVKLLYDEASTKATVLFFDTKATGIQSITGAPKSSKKAYFGVDGQQHPTLQRGVNIVREANGQLMKVVTK